ncbi:MAG: hypothetical protein AB7N91_15035 [Candidatus Tectimicrobiota bacterium]
MSRLAEELAEENQSLLLLAASPVIWGAHFMLSYITAAIWCARLAGPGATLESVRLAILLYTVLALSGIGSIGWLALRRHRYGTATPPHDDDTPEDRHRFLGFAALLLSALSAVATLYAALVVVFIRSCH